MNRPALRLPYFEIGVKNYVYGDDVLKYALAADAAAEKYDIDVIFITPYTEIRRVAEKTSRLFVFAPYMDILPPGRGMADVLPEALKAAGAVGVVVNHCERPMTLPQIKRTIDRARGLGMLSFACADSIAETKAIAELRPDVINPEPTELIGTGKSADMSFVKASVDAVKGVCPDILVEMAAGITCGREVYDFIRAGADAAGAASGIFKASDPAAMIDEMVAAVRSAADDMKGETK